MGNKAFGYFIPLNDTELGSDIVMKVFDDMGAPAHELVSIDYMISVILALGGIKSHNSSWGRFDLPYRTGIRDYHYTVILPHDNIRNSILYERISYTPYLRMDTNELYLIPVVSETSVVTQDRSIRFIKFLEMLTSLLSYQTGIFLAFDFKTKRYEVMTER